MTKENVVDLFPIKCIQIETGGEIGRILMDQCKRCNKLSKTYGGLCSNCHDVGIIATFVGLSVVGASIGLIASWLITFIDQSNDFHWILIIGVVLILMKMFFMVADKFILTDNE